MLKYLEIMHYILIIILLCECKVISLNSWTVFNINFMGDNQYHILLFLNFTIMKLYTVYFTFYACSWVIKFFAVDLQVIVDLIST